MHVNIIYHKKKQQSALKITGASIIIIINNEVIHIYTLSYTCEVSFFLIHNEQTIKTLTMDCFLSSHYHRETTCGDERLLLTQWGIQYRLSWCLVIQWTQTQQNSSYDIYRFQRFPGYISLTLSYWFQTLTADFHTMFLSAQSWSWNILAGDQMI